MFAKVLSACLFGLETEAAYAEVDVSRGLPKFQIVGLANQAVREAAERIHAALCNCGLEFPARRVTVNLTPANRSKQGSHFDLPIAVALLLAAGFVQDKNALLRGTAVFGELSLDGEINGVDGVLPMLIGMRRAGIARAIVPQENLAEAMLLRDMEILPFSHLTRLLRVLSGSEEPERRAGGGESAPSEAKSAPDFSEIKGQEQVKRAAQLAAAGRHGLLLIGPPGSGKSLSCRRIPGIMPPLSYEEQMEVTQIYSVAGLLSPSHPVVSERPFRAPHHSVSAAALAGGGSSPRPGEISLAHKGVLFLDELAEFPAHTLDTLRQPMEDGQIIINRAAGSCVFPADFMLVAAMNPCRCGYYGDPVRPCTCNESARRQYIGRVSGPLLDRIDIHVALQRTIYDDMKKTGPSLSSAQLREGVERAVCMQKDRYRFCETDCNARLSPQQIERFCALSEAGGKIMEAAYERLHLSARSYHKILKVARTAADIDGCEQIEEAHLLEALSYRRPERFFE